MNNVIDVVGHIKLVNGQTLTEHLILDEVEIATTRRLLVHVQSHEYMFSYLLVTTSLYFS